ncbi:MFS transporter [Streptomyces sp. NPDC048045]|uniref:MFS transporter n=1 Tax=Streptomyces sp. NPDC048045 TaxID=3154710 RepID=UPI00343E8E25
MLPFLLLSLPAGVVVDRLAKHKLMMWCDIGRLLLAPIPLATLPGWHLTFAQLLIVSLLSGVLAVFFDIACTSYVPVLLPGDERMDANEKLGTTASFAEFAGPSIGGGLVGLLGAARAICADAATYALSALSALSLFLIRGPAPEPRAEGRKMKQEIERRRALHRLGLDAGRRGRRRHAGHGGGVRETLWVSVIGRWCAGL